MTPAPHPPGARDPRAADGGGARAGRPLPEPPDGAHRADAWLRPRVGRRRGRAPDRLRRHGATSTCFGGYGVFAIGRNHPEAIAAVQEVAGGAHRQPAPAGRHAAQRACSPSSSLARAPASVGAMVPANTGTEAVEAAIKLARAATGRPRILYAEHAFHGLTLGVALAQRRRAVPRGLRPAAARLRAGARSAISTRSSARSRAATWRRSSSSPCRARASTCRPTGYLRRRAGALPRGRRAVRLRRGADRARAHRALPRARALGPRARHDLLSPRRSPAASCRSARVLVSPRRLRARVRRRWSAACATARPSAATTSRPPRASRRCGCSSARASSSVPRGWASCCSSSRGRSSSATRSCATCAASG